MVRIAGVDVTDAIREPRIDDAASRVASHEGVRDVLIARQRQLSLDRDSVLDGRDCGTVVRPDADLKIFVTADLDERARRRSGQQDELGTTRSADVARELQARDARDAKQSGAAADAIVVDTTSLGIDEAVDHVVQLWLQRRRELLDDEVTMGRTAREWIENEAGLATFEPLLKRTRPIWEKGFRLTAVGAERVPDRNCLFIANHASMWDPAFLIVPLSRVIRYMGKAELANNRYVKYAEPTRSASSPVRRGAGDRVALHIGEEVLRRGDSLGIFPGGHPGLRGPPRPTAPGRRPPRPRHRRADRPGRDLRQPLERVAVPGHRRLRPSPLLRRRAGHARQHPQRHHGGLGATSRSSGTRCARIGPSRVPRSGRGSGSSRATAASRACADGGRRHRSTRGSVMPAAARRFVQRVGPF